MNCCENVESKINVIHKRKIIIYGFGQGGKDAVTIKKDDENIVAICNSTPVDVSVYQGIPIIQPDELQHYDYDVIVIASVYFEEITAHLQSIGIKSEKIEFYQGPTVVIDKRFFDARKLVKRLTLLNELGQSQPLPQQIEQLYQNYKDQLNHQELLLVYDFLILNKSFSLALTAREKAQQLLLSEQVDKLSQDELVQLCLTYLDRNQLHEFYQFVDTYGTRLNTQNRQYLQFMYTLVTANQYPKQTAKECNKQTLFTQKLNGKKVAIVGPCLNDLQQGKYIDQFDIVIRLLPSLYGGLNVGREGSKTDVVYVAAHKINTMKKDNNDLLNITGVDYVVEPSFAKEELELTSNQKFIGYPVTHLFHAFGNFLLRVIVDIAQTSPKQIEVFNFDLYTSKQSYDPNYLSFLDNDKAAPLGTNLLINQAFFHDFASQFNLLKILNKLDKLKCDPVLDSILSLTTEQYFERLQSAFSHKEI